MAEDFDEFEEFPEDYDDFDDYQDFEDFEDFDDEDDNFEDLDDIDFDNLDSQSKEELDIFDERPLETDSRYDINAVEVHISTQLTSQKIIELMDTYPSLKRITCPQSIYNRISPTYIKALDNLGVSVEVKYNWGKRKYSKNQINQVVDLFNEGKRSDEIASILDMSVSNVDYIKSKYFDRINVKHYRRKYDDACRQKVKAMREKGIKPKQISQELNIPVRSIYYILNKK
ncbi:hypothetical protein [Methanobrevibacter sp.]|uniref:hypothetical protein n=1 Tax=Methanobrevibacter sp. TaxID=66852 RepID=UPI0025DB067C|nr:hypothetical protein [Methanobrevibacter sp.]MBQ2962290.1 hypothetical protein [Methanobrevibacter sp.]